MELAWRLQEKVFKYLKKKKKTAVSGIGFKPVKEKSN